MGAAHLRFGFGNRRGTAVALVGLVAKLHEVPGPATAARDLRCVLARRKAGAECRTDGRVGGGVEVACRSDLVEGRRAIS